MSFILQATPAVADTTSTATTSSMSYFELLMKGGPMMYPLILLSIISIALIIERYLYIKQMSKIDENLVKQALDKIYNGQVSTASLMCEQSKSSLGNVLKAGIDTLGKPIEHVEKALSVQSNIELSTMESRMGYISIISGIAPRLGFIGTIIGVIVIFYSIAQTADISIGHISAGLYQKMISSGMGLVVGVISFLGYNYLLTKVDSFSLQLQKQVLEFIKGIAKPA